MILIGQRQLYVTELISKIFNTIKITNRLMKAQEAFQAFLDFISEFKAEKINKFSFTDV